MREMANPDLKEIAERMNPREKKRGEKEESEEGKREELIRENRDLTIQAWPSPEISTSKR